MIELFEELIKRGYIHRRMAGDRPGGQPWPEYVVSAKLTKELEERHDRR